MHYTDYDTRLAAYAVITDDQGRVLLALWNEGSRRQWTMPGGGVELDEGVEQAVVREVREETGYDATVGSLLGVDTYVLPPHRRLNDSDRPLKAVRILFRAEVVGGGLAYELDGSTDEARWFTLDEVRGLDRVSVVDISLRFAGLV